MRGPPPGHDVRLTSDCVVDAGQQSHPAMGAQLSVNPTVSPTDAQQLPSTHDAALRCCPTCDRGMSRLGWRDHLSTLAGSGSGSKTDVAPVDRGIRFEASPRFEPSPGLAGSGQSPGGSGTACGAVCPRWDSNPHWRDFETRDSAGWSTGAMTRQCTEVTQPGGEPLADSLAADRSGVAQCMVAVTVSGAVERLTPTTVSGAQEVVMPMVRASGGLVGLRCVPAPSVSAVCRCPRCRPSVPSVDAVRQRCPSVPSTRECTSSTPGYCSVTGTLCTP